MARTVPHIVDGPRRYELVLRLPDQQRSPQDLARTLIDTPAGRIPVSSIATVEETDGPNQIGRENGRRRIIVYANTDGGDMGRVIADIRSIIEDTLATGQLHQPGGQFQAQEQATRLIAGLSVVSLVMMFLVLYSRYQSVVLAGIIMANIPLALIGSVVAMWIAGVSLSVASMVGFITLAGIATRNGILKISHYINLCKFEGESLRPGDDRARLAGAADAGADDGAGGGLRADAAAAGGRRPGQGDPAPGGGGDLRRAGQLDAARHAADAGAVLALHCGHNVR
jgi:Cu/Ag efflux pump CusA